MKTMIWFLAIGTALLLVLTVLWIIPDLWGYGGMMGGYGMMGHNYGIMNPLGWFGMAFMWLIPAAILIILTAGVVALITNLIRPSGPRLPSNPPTGDLACQACGKPTQPDWNTCPFCGQPLA